MIDSDVTVNRSNDNNDKCDKMPFNIIIRIGSTYDDNNGNDNNQ